MKRSIPFLLLPFFIAVLVLLVRLFQFDPDETLANSLKSGLSAAFAPGRMNVGNFNLAFKWPLLVRADRFTISLGNSAVKADSAIVPVTIEEILSGKVRTRKLQLLKTVFVFTSLQDLGAFAGGFFRSDKPDQEMLRDESLGDFLIEANGADFFYRDPTGPFPHLSFKLDHFSMNLASDGFRKLRGIVSTSQSGGLSFDLSSDPVQELAILNFSESDQFEAKVEFYPENSRIAYRFQSVLLGRDLSLMLPPKWKAAEYLKAPLKGKITAHSAADGTLRARASLEASPGVLQGINLPYEVLRSLTRLPLFSRLMEGEWRNEALKASTSSTPFVSAQIEMAVNGQNLVFEELLMTHPEYDIVLSGGINFSLGTGTVNLEGEIFFTGALADELLQKEPLFEALLTPDGLRLAFLCLGPFPGVKVETDINDAAGLILEMESEQIAAKGIDSLNRYMESKK